jgi:hypothetical protein
MELVSWLVSLNNTILEAPLLGQGSGPNGPADLPPPHMGPPIGVYYT